MIEKIIKKYRKETEEAFWKLAYKLAMNYDLIPINKGVYELREKTPRPSWEERGLEEKINGGDRRNDVFDI
ncbi:hypothetical protein DRN73_09860 [Candidatus Pacearchaeota archaeon]|nr:MAG: hypothetical protein DRN73_09860 [Candidatus Pacearchaeota archaeon]